MHDINIWEQPVIIYTTVDYFAVTENASIVVSVSGLVYTRNNRAKNAWYALTVLCNASDKSVHLKEWIKIPAGVCGGLFKVTRVVIPRSHI